MTSVGLKHKACAHTELAMPRQSLSNWFCQMVMAKHHLVKTKQKKEKSILGFFWCFSFRQNLICEPLMT